MNFLVYWIMTEKGRVEPLKRDTNNNNKIFSALWRNVRSVLVPRLQQYFPFSTMRRRKGNFIRMLIISFLFRWYFLRSDRLCTWISLCFMSSHFFMLQYARWWKGKLVESGAKIKKTLDSLCLFSDAFWFIIKEEKLNNSELIKWFKALISYLLRLLPLLSIHSNYGKVLKVTSSVSRWDDTNRFVPKTRASFRKTGSSVHGSSDLPNSQFLIKNKFQYFQTSRTQWNMFDFR